MGRQLHVLRSACLLSSSNRSRHKLKNNRPFKSNQPSQLSLGSAHQAMKCETSCSITFSEIFSKVKNQKAATSLITGSCMTICSVLWLKLPMKPGSIQIVILIWRKVQIQGPNNWEKYSRALSTMVFWACISTKKKGNIGCKVCSVWGRFLLKNLPIKWADISLLNDSNLQRSTLITKNNVTRWKFSGSTKERVLHLTE